MSEKVNFTYDVMKDDYINGGKASSEIKKTLHKLGLDNGFIRKIAISSYEAEMNLVIHSQGGKIKLEINEGLIRLISIDCGPGILNIEQAMKPGFSTANDKAREMGFGAGMGLPNMMKNTDNFRIHSSLKGTKIIMDYYLGGD